jgi:Family of unknown function (DUF5808)
MKNHGTMLGIPYDFRMPTLSRVRERFWNPEDPRIFTPRVFGVGWDINLPSLRKRSEPAFYAAVVLYAIIALNMIRSILRMLRRLKGSLQ